jgi:hypothetical protein
MVGGGAAALAGLVFIAMSINLSIITRDATHKNRAVATMTGFTAVFMICALALMGNQSYRWIGVEWLVVTLVPTITYLRVYVRARKMGRSSVGLKAKPELRRHVLCRARSPLLGVASTREMRLLDTSTLVPL